MVSRSIAIVTLAGVAALALAGAGSSGNGGGNGDGNGGNGDGNGGGNGSGGLSMTQGNDLLTITSSANDWKAVFDVTRNASGSNVGGAVVTRLQIPASNNQNLVPDKPGAVSVQTVFSLGNLEWRYIQNGRGIRSDMGRNADISSFNITENTSNKIVFNLKGSWRGVRSFDQTTTIDPKGFSTDIKVEYDGSPGGVRGMWWNQMGLLANAVDAPKATVRDSNTGPVKLPFAQEGVFSLPSGIGFPYTVDFPLIGRGNRSMKITVAEFGDSSNDGLKYELWPEQRGWYVFYPRFVHNPFQNKTYRFRYRWDF